MWDFEIAVSVPNEVKSIINSGVLTTENGITLRALSNLRLPRYEGETVSAIEDAENHFHVAQYVARGDSTKAISLGVKSTRLLAEALVLEGLSEVRIWYSVQTPELGIAQAVASKIHAEGDQYFLSDRLSFYRRRYGQDDMAELVFDNQFYGVLIIDVA